MNNGWKIITNGKTYRLQNKSYKFFAEHKGCFFFSWLEPVNFKTLEEAQAKLAELEQEDKDNTWVPV